MKFLFSSWKFAQVRTSHDWDGFPALGGRQSDSIFPNGIENNFLSGEVQHFYEDDRIFVLAYPTLCQGSLQF